ncbi:hypothetical protein LH464_18325 [Neorhizobium sp. T786]|uniref:hypothetical protein n=1 Tax=Pseudorhizobium xiangyangii TaxID=2883104 RepID=UPI001CFFEAD5|nr:hypothetical protein [Neorhizobium xiangyangii]MCB5204429.1 hypothetical protein [Neorhizobium xiangyangii]
MTPRNPSSLRFATTLNALNGIGVRDHEIAKELGYTRQYISLLRSSRPPPARLIEQVQALLVSKLAEIQAIHQREADKLAAQRKQFESEVAA